ncbi:Hypothetical protein NTJ_09359 [Nesidiocoris tenuis]|uniref:Uncharacterized protein n=1 Tax=Nesidiocoris tenuis TaxID=355587 RepID=A0ABN7AX56_9HEMI|nr:Hypothetical protein NTJ_09359 [Nesidiocoris tenuis]
MSSNISEMFNHFFSRKHSSKKKDEIEKAQYNDQIFYRSKSGRYRSIKGKRAALTEDMFSPMQQPTSCIDVRPLTSNVPSTHESTSKNANESSNE